MAVRKISIPSLMMLQALAIERTVATRTADPVQYSLISHIADLRSEFCDAVPSFIPLGSRSFGCNEKRQHFVRQMIVKQLWFRSVPESGKQLVPGFTNRKDVGFRWKRSSKLTSKWSCTTDKLAIAPVRIGL